MAKYCCNFRCLMMCFAITCCLYQANAQTDPNDGSFRFFSMKLHHGSHFYTSKESPLKDRLKYGYASIELRYGWQSKGKREWERVFNYPAYGVGWYSGYVGDVEIFGNPNALFGFVTFPITNRRRNNFQIEPALGLTYNLKPYNPESNAMNDAIGARFAVYFSLHAGGRYRLKRELDFLYGVDATHFSNGRTVTPNTGLNMLGFSLGFCYHFNTLQGKIDNSMHPKTVVEVRPTYGKREKSPRLNEKSVSIYQALGTVQNKDGMATDIRYLTSSTVLEYQHKFNTMHGVNIGFDAFIDPSARDTSEFKTNVQRRSFFPAAHVGYDFSFWKLSVRLQVGVHLSSLGRELKSTTFMRPAIRYDFSKRFYTQLGLKTRNGGTADWVEFGLGYKVFDATRQK